MAEVTTLVLPPPQAALHTTASNDVGGLNGPVNVGETARPTSGYLGPRAAVGAKTNFWDAGV